MMNYKVLTNKEWQLEAKLMDSGIHFALNNVIDTHVSAKYLADTLVKELTDYLTTQTQIQIKQEWNGVVVLSCYNNSNQPPQIKSKVQSQSQVHLYFWLKEGEPHLFDVRIWQDGLISEEVLDACCLCVQQVFGKERLSVTAALGGVGLSYSSLLRLPKISQVLTNAYNNTLMEPTTIRILQHLKEVIETDTVIFTIPAQTTFQLTKLADSIISSSFINFKIKIEDNVTILGDCTLKSAKLESVGANLQADKLTIDNIERLKLPFKCQYLSLPYASTAVLDLSKVTADSAAISNNTALTIVNAKAINEMNIYGLDTGRCLIENSSIPSLRAIAVNLVLSPSVQLNTLIVEYINQSLEINGALVQDLLVEELYGAYGDKRLTISNLCVQGNLTIASDSVVLPEYSLVYGDCSINPLVPLPSNFSCLGQLVERL